MAVQRSVFHDKTLVTALQTIILGPMSLINTCILGSYSQFRVRYRLVCRPEYSELKHPGQNM